MTKPHTSPKPRANWVFAGTDCTGKKRFVLRRELNKLERETESMKKLKKQMKAKEQMLKDGVKIYYEETGINDSDTLRQTIKKWKQRRPI